MFIVPSKMLDLEAWPVVHIRVPEHISVELLGAFEAEFKAMLQRAVAEGRRVVMYIDPSRCTNASMKHVTAVSRIMSDNRALVEKAVRCSLLLVQTRLWRTLFGALFALVPPTRPLRMFRDSVQVTHAVLGYACEATLRLLR